ncbi:hypothetical protein MKW98_013174 [Papaver atlanticum]|uniref:S-adenosyl-L-methionine-dependent methyltransferase n=1 Tax=Papaver atlanticum TaxID=357466 RepID=A0AAD4T8L8_9MAGN|nr:hypothetical protein MKW98_013174 [Papaver atlanticum]
MGSVTLKLGDGTARHKRASLCSSALNFIMLFSVLATNLFAFYAFTSTPKTQTGNKVSLISEHTSKSSVPNELKLFLQFHPLPLGKDSRTGMAEMVSSIGHSCEKSMSFLSQFMNYKVGGVCPDDWSLAQNLILRGCEPLPRRRCLTKPITKEGLFPFPLSLWQPVSNNVVTWSGLGCKNFGCLYSKKIIEDCVGCFDLVNGNDKQKFVKASSKIDFLVDDVLALGNGGIRIGLDIGGGSGNLAARMAERNVTLVTSTLNVDAPFNDFIARFPFYDNVFVLIHISKGISNGDRSEKMEFLMFDVDRILRVGGLFWLDSYYCSDNEQKRIFTHGKWIVGEKFDANQARKPKVYLSALLQKPTRLGY